MNVWVHELKRGIRSTLIWGLVIGGTIMLCVFLFPELKRELGDMVDAMSDIGGFGAAFGMDQLNYGDITGFYGIYAGSMLGIGGIFYAAVLGIGLLAKEEKDHTADFLLTHPVTRTSVFWQKAGAMAVQIFAMNVLVAALAALAVFAIGESPDWEGIGLFHAGQLLMQAEVGCVCLGISAFLRRGSVSIGIGIAAFLYFLGLLGNITEKAEMVKYITPYAYADAAHILPKGALDGPLIFIGFIYGAGGILAGWLRYRRKDIG